MVSYSPAKLFEDLKRFCSEGSIEKVVNALKTIKENQLDLTPVFEDRNHEGGINGYDVLARCIGKGGKIEILELIKQQWREISFDDNEIAMFQEAVNNDKVDFIKALIKYSDYADIRDLRGTPYYNKSLEIQKIFWNYEWSELIDILKDQVGITLEKFVNDSTLLQLENIKLEIENDLQNDYKLISSEDAEHSDQSFFFKIALKDLEFFIQNFTPELYYKPGEGDTSGESEIIGQSIC